MLVGVYLARHLIGPEALLVEENLSCPGYVRLFGDWDLCKVSPIRGSFVEVETTAAQLDKMRLDKRILFAWSPVEFEETFVTPGRIVGYAEFQICPWLLSRFGFSALEAARGAAFAALPSDQSLVAQIILGLGQADLIVLADGDTFTRIRDAFIAVRGLTYASLPDGLREQIAAEPGPHETRQLFSWSYSAVGYVPPANVSYADVARTVADVDDVDPIDMAPSIYVSSRPGRGRHVVARLKAADLPLRTETYAIQGLFDLRLDCLPRNDTWTSREVLGDTLCTMAILYKELGPSIAGTSTVWRTTNTRILTTRASNDLRSMVPYATRTLVLPDDHRAELRERLGVERTCLLESLIAIYNVSAVHPLTSTYALDIGEFLRGFLRWFPDALKRVPEANISNAARGAEGMWRRILMGLVGRTSMATHALHAEPLYHPGLGIQKIIIAINEVAHRVFERFSKPDSVRSQHVLFCLSPVGQPRGFVFAPVRDDEEYILYEIAPDSFFRGAVFAVAHDIFHRIELGKFDGRAWESALTSELSEWIAREFSVLIPAGASLAERVHEGLRERMQETSAGTRAAFLATGRERFLADLLADVAPSSVSEAEDTMAHLDRVATRARAQMGDIQGLASECRADVFAAALLGPKEYLDYLSRTAKQTWAPYAHERVDVLTAVLDKNLASPLPHVTALLRTILKDATMEVERDTELLGIRSLRAVGDGLLPSEEAIGTYYKWWGLAIERMGSEQY